MDAYKKFTHKTPHLKGKQHQLDPNIDLKQLVHHAAVQYVDRDADGDVDVYDNPKKKTPDENPIGVDFGNLSKKLIAKQKGEIKHTKRGMAYEEVEEKCGKGMYWCNTNKECKPLPTGFNVPGQKIKPTEVGIGKPVEGACNHTKKGKTCPVHGNEDCSMKESKDHEYSMARSELSTVMNAVKRLQKKMGKGEGNVEAWVQSKITKAADYLDSAADYIDSGEMEESFVINPTAHKVAAKRRKIEALTTSPNPNEAGVAKRKLGKTAELPKVKKEEKLVDKILSKLQEEDPCWSGYKQQGMKKKGKKIVPNCVPVGEETKSGDSSLHDWFSKSKSSDGKPGWVQLGGKYAGKPCAKQPGQTTKPKCGSSKMASEMSPEEEDSAARRKRKEDPNSERSGKAKNVATEEFVNEDACKEKVKSRYKIWPSAYASGAVVKCRKVGAANWGNKTKNENVSIEDANGNLYAEFVDLIKPEPMVSPKSSFMSNNDLGEATRLQSETGNIIAVILSWRGKTYSVRMFFPQAGMPSRKDITDEIQKVYPGSQVIQYNVSTLQPGMPLIQVVNSKSKNYLLNNKTIGEENIEEEGPVLSVGRGEKLPVSKGAGLTAKGREKYNRETGSNLQAPVTGEVKPGSKAAQRRKNFCSRSRSWDGERGLAARKRWKC